MDGRVGMGMKRKECQRKCKKVAILVNQITENEDIAKYAGHMAKRISSCITKVQII